MDSTQNQIHAEIGDDDAEESKDAVDMEERRLAEREQHVVEQRHGID